MIVIQLNKMIENIDNTYERYMKKNRGKEYVFARLWEDYYIENSDEEMIVYNLIIAKKNIEEKTVSNNNWNCIGRVVKKYENNQESIRNFFSGKDCMVISQIYNDLKIILRNVDCDINIY